MVTLQQRIRERKMSDTFYPVVVAQLFEADGGGYMAYAPDLKGCMSPGDTPEEAVKNVRQAMAEWIAEAKEIGRAIPEPNSGARKAKEAREKLVEQMREQNAAIEALDRELREMRSSLKLISEGMLEEPSAWGISIALLGHNETSDDVVH
jgi:antitoxin HicB